jgi:GTPase SAR1 family protein
MVLGNTSSRGALIAGDDVLDPAANDECFVELSFHKMIVQRKKVHGKLHETPDLVELKLQSILNETSQKILILGDAGSGKSTCILRLAYELVREGLNQEKGLRIPILVRAIDIASKKPADLLSYLDEVTRKIGKARRACFTMKELNNGGLIVFVDSLDEIAEDNDRRYALTQVNEFAKRFPKVKIIATSRPYRFTSELTELSSYERYNISPMSWKQSEKIFKRVQKGKQIPTTVANEVLRKLEKMHGIELNPLLVTVFAAASDVSRQDIPANITELFKKFTELMLGRWDERKGVEHQYRAPLKDFVVMRLAFSMHQRKLKSVSRRQVEEIINEELEKTGHAPEGAQILKEVLDRSGLFRVIGENVEFRHHLLQEFFAGRAIPNADYVSQVITDEWWTRALVFYFGENPSRVDVLKSLTSQFESDDVFAISLAAYAVGLAIQACYLSPVTEKLEVWKWVNRALVSSRDKTLSATSKALGVRVPLLMFVTHYFYHRDSVALSNLRDNHEDLVSWCRADPSLLDEDRDAAVFWLITGLIESGDLDIANDVCAEFYPKDPRLLVALHMGSYFADKVRPVDKRQKLQAKEICRRFASKVAPYQKQLTKEWGSLLLEYQQGALTVVDEEEDATRDGK